jgi:hypothetical protein
VPPGEPSALAAALTRLAHDAELRERLAAGARDAFATRFEAARFEAELGAAYAELGLEPS